MMAKKKRQNPKTEDPVMPEAEKARLADGDSFWKSRNNLLFLLAILSITFGVYLPSLQNGFVNWDDGFYIYTNPLITDISNWKSFFISVKEIFATHVNEGYTPITVLSFAFEKMVYGLNRPGMWHLNNIILHLVCVLLVFRIALALGLKLIPAAFCALLFGIQPMRVESVAWLTERKDVLFGSFYLLALYYYIKSVKSSFRKQYLFIIIASFIIALLSKIQAVTLPLSMLLVDYYFGRTLSMKLIYEKWLYFFISLVTGAVGIYFLRFGGESLGASHNYFSIFQRIFIGPYSFVIYFIKSLLPYKMVPIHPYPDPNSWSFYASIIIAPSIIGSTYYFFHTHKKTMVLGILFFTFNIMFLLQTLSAGRGFIADRFTYIAYFGLFLIYASGLQWLLEKHRKFDRLVYVALLVILTAYGYVNFEQNKIWRNGETLWTHELKYYPFNFSALFNRAEYYLAEGRNKEAIEDYNKALALRPYDPHVYLSRGVAYGKLNMHAKAFQDFNKAEKLDPSHHETYRNKSIIHIRLGQYDKAYSELKKYAILNPGDPEVWSTLESLNTLRNRYGKPPGTL
jgi:hypothetical protein